MPFLGSSRLVAMCVRVGMLFSTIRVAMAMAVVVEEE